MNEAQALAWLEGTADTRLLGAARPFPVEGKVTGANGIITGSGAAAAQAEMKSLKARYGAAPDPRSMAPNDLEEYLEKIKNLPSVGVTTMSTVSLMKSGWVPEIGNSRNVPAKFLDYLAILSKAPCMEFQDQKDQKITYKKRDFNDLIDQATQLLKASIGGDTDDIIDALTVLAKSVLNNEKSTDTMCVLSQHAIPISADDVGYQVFVTQASVTKSSGKGEFIDSTLNVYNLKLKFSIDLWKSGIYRAIGSKVYKDAEDWLKDIDTPIPVGAQKLCIEEA